MRKLSLVIACIMVITTFSCIFPVKISVADPPDAPTNPYPPNNSIDVSINIILNWTCNDPDPGDKLSFDVYFGKTNPPDKIISNQSEIFFYDPGILTHLTTYYWRIVAWDKTEVSTSGPVWNFTTKQNQPPTEPNNPTPADSSPSVSINAQLSWGGGDPDPGDTVTYDVYFGTSNPPPKIGDGNQSGTSYDPGTMQYTTFYYWRIVVWDNHNSSTNGPLWNFITESPGNQPPYVPSNPSPSDGFLGALINTTLSWSGGDPDGDPVIYDIYFGTSSSPPKVKSNQSETSYDPDVLEYVTVYYWKIVAWDNQNASSSGPVWNFTTKSEINRPPNVPNSPLPRNGTINVPVNADISWVGGDPDPGDTVSYDVYFDTLNPPINKEVSNMTTTSYDPGTMGYITTYYWRIVAWDQLNNSTTSPIYHFRTTAQSGGGGEEPQPPQNIEPIANAGGPYQGVVNSVIRFNGSRSYDPDGNISSWSWDFGDNTKANGRIVDHSFVVAGNYTVLLTVIDDNNVTDSDSTICHIIKQTNHPPEKPLIIGNTSGTKNIIYTYVAQSTDQDNDHLQYIFVWSDSIPQESGFIPSGQNFSVNRSWNSAGRYNLTVRVTDNQNTSSSKITIYIDAIQTRGAGYLYDIDGDGVYDAFYSDETHKTVLVPNNGENYFIDKDGDGQWEYVYNATYGLTSYQEPRKTPGFEASLVLGAITVALVLWRKKRLF